jgi:hypothetical protein
MTSCGASEADEIACPATLGQSRSRTSQSQVALANDSNTAHVLNSRKAPFAPFQGFTDFALPNSTRLVLHLRRAAVSIIPNPHLRCTANWPFPNAAGLKALGPSLPPSRSNPPEPPSWILHKDHRCRPQSTRSGSAATRLACARGARRSACRRHAASPAVLRALA